MRFQVVGAEAQGSVLTITMSVTNQGIDRELRASFYVACGGAAEIIDDRGNTYNTHMVRIGNRDCSSNLLNGVATTMTLTFQNMATIGGVIEANQIKRLALPNLQIALEGGPLDFMNIPIRKN
jgi:hypothetical protein